MSAETGTAGNPRHFHEADFLAVEDPDFSILLNQESTEWDRPMPLFVDAPDGPVPSFLSKPVRLKRQNVRCLSVPEALVLGERAFVTRRGRLFNDERLWYLPNLYADAGRRAAEFMPIEPVDSGFVSKLVDRPSENIKGSVVLLSSLEHHNYGSWWARMVPKLVTLKSLDLGELRCLAPADVPWQRELLRFIGVAESHIIAHNRRRSYRIENLIVPTQRSPNFVLDGETIAFFDGLAENARHQAADLKARELIYVSRLNQARRNPYYRVCSNEGQLAELLSRFGFFIYEPERDPIALQAATFRTAKIVVGPSGAGMFNTVFCQPGTIVLSLEPLELWLRNHCALFASRGLRYGFILGGADPGDQSTQKRWTANLALVERRVRELLRQ
jgi:hypothetical protein